MDLALNLSLGNPYKSATQKSRVITEGWIAENMFCPICGCEMLTHYTNNRPVADFYCPKCCSDFELKSRQSISGNISQIIPDGAYATMIERIASFNNPNLLVMTYARGYVNTLVLVPNFFFTSDVIIKRKPLGPTARRAGWQGCNIDFGSIPDIGKISIIQNSHEIPQSEIIQNYNKAILLKTNNLDSRGWLMDTLICVQSIPTTTFSLNDVYKFADKLRVKHPNNNHIYAKIRQQLQLLRDKGLLEFTTRGHYKKVE